MKIKLMIALAVMALVLGMVLIACDDGELPVIKDTDTTQTLDLMFLGDPVVSAGGAYTDDKGNILSPKESTVEKVVDPDDEDGKKMIYESDLFLKGIEEMMKGGDDGETASPF